MKNTQLYTTTMNSPFAFGYKVTEMRKKIVKTSFMWVSTRRMSMQGDGNQTQANEDTELRILEERYRTVHIADRNSPRLLIDRYLVPQVIVSYAKYHGSM